MREPSPESLAQFLALIEKRLGFECADWQQQKLPLLLRERAKRAPGLGGQQGYLNWLATLDPSHAEFMAIAADLSVGETYFFREPKALEALTQHVLGELLAKGQKHPLRFLSAGCASGEEPYTLALLLRKALGESAAERVQIVGVDISLAALQKAEKAVYSEWSLRATPHDMRRKWFSPKGNDFVLQENIRSMVSFYAKNLLAPEHSFKDIGHFDVIFCRNVTIYFAPQAIAQTIGLLTRLLHPGGFLFLGHSESLRDVSDRFELVNRGDAFYYRRLPHHKSKPPPPSSKEPAQNEFSWLSTIEESARRIDAVTSPQIPAPTVQAPPALTTRARKSGSFQSAFELIRAERFADAIALLQSSRKSGPSDDADQELLLAVACSNQGQFSTAEEICTRLLRNSRGTLAAEALYILGLCYEHTGDPSMAMHHYQLASAEDPSFAMPHLHMGLLYKKTRKPGQARAAFERAANLVSSEKAERIVLFGGGFQKNALLSLCKNEILNIGGME